MCDTRNGMALSPKTGRNKERLGSIRQGSNAHCVWTGAMGGYDTLLVMAVRKAMMWHAGRICSKVCRYSGNSQERQIHVLVPCPPLRYLSNVIAQLSFRHPMFFVGHSCFIPCNAQALRLLDGLFALTPRRRLALFEKTYHQAR